MKTSIIRECGHEETITVYGPYKDRERRIEYERTRLCTACYNAKRNAERKAAEDEARAVMQRMNLPQLQGTEKKVGWAADIRLRRVVDLLDWLRENQVEVDAFLAEWSKGKGGQFAHIVRGFNEPDATVWINGRFAPFHDWEWSLRPKTKSGDVVIGRGPKTKSGDVVIGRGWMRKKTTNQDA